jgi:hypothetical protein
MGLMQNLATQEASAAQGEYGMAREEDRAADSEIALGVTANQNSREAARKAENVEYRCPHCKTVVAGSTRSRAPWEIKPVAPGAAGSSTKRRPSTGRWLNAELTVKRFSSL